MQQQAPQPVKPCPFCGGQAVIQRAAGQAFSCVCKGCGAVVVHQTAQGRAGLVQRWNTRQSRPNFSVQSNTKPCPFCACRQEVTLQRGQSGPIAVCRACGMMVSFATADTPAALLQRWNARRG